MRAWIVVHLLNGKKRRGVLTTDNPASSYGLPVAVISPASFQVALGSAEVAGIEVAQEWRELAEKAGYKIIEGSESKEAV